MALIDEVRSRYSTEVLVSVSNPQSGSATTEDTTRSGLAATDIDAYFEMHGIDYDNSDARHVMVATQGVIARLMVMTAQPGAQDEWRQFTDNIELLTKSTSRDRILPTTDSLLTATEDTSGNLPAADRKQFDGYVSEPPSGQSSAND